MWYSCRIFESDAAPMWSDPSLHCRKQRLIVFCVLKIFFYPKVVQMFLCLSSPEAADRNFLNQWINQSSNVPSIESGAIELRVWCVLYEPRPLLNMHLCNRYLQKNVRCSILKISMADNLRAFSLIRHNTVSFFCLQIEWQTIQNLHKINLAFCICVPRDKE